VHLVEGPLVLLQLQQVPAAGQSAQMTVEHQEQPAAREVREPPRAPRQIRQLEGRRGSADSIFRSAGHVGPLCAGHPARDDSLPPLVHDATHTRT
jgi:hypothetical protein